MASSMTKADGHDYALVIPARLGGTRLPGKPMISILGKPMIQHVIEQCSKVVPLHQVYVVTEDDLIEEFVSKIGVQVVKTGFAETAIDRIFLFSKIIHADTYITVLGDEPLINPKDIEKIIDFARRKPDVVVMGKAPASAEEFNDASKAKVVCSWDGRLLYSSRAGIPVDKVGNFASAERAIWVYAFPKESLERYYTSSKLGVLESLEGNEILRFLEIGEQVYCVDVIGDSWAVDEPKDLKVVEDRLRMRGDR